MPSDPVPVTLIHAEPLDGDASQERIVAMASASTAVVALRAFGGGAATAECTFDLAEAEKLARACLAGNLKALREPGLARILCAATIVFSKAAFMAGALVAEDAGDDPDG